MASITLVKLSPHYTVSIANNCRLIMEKFLGANIPKAREIALARNPGAEVIAATTFEMDTTPDWAVNATAV